MSTNLRASSTTTLRNGLMLLGLNLLLESLLAAAVISFLQHEDLLQAASFAVLAAPGLLLQPWFICLLLLPGGILYAPIISAPVTLWCYRQAMQKAWFTRIYQLVRLWKPISVLTGAVLTVSLLTALIYLRAIDFPALKHDNPPIPTAGYAFHDPLLYRSDGIMWDSSWLWRIRITPAQLPAATAALSLHPTTPAKMPAAFFSQPPYWWRPLFAGETRVYSTGAFPAEDFGEEGTQILALWNPSDGLMYLWIKNSF